MSNIEIPHADSSSGDNFQQLFLPSPLNSTKKLNIQVYKGGLSQHKLKLVTDYINDYLEQESTLKELAAIVQLSRYHFSRVFKQSTGISPHQYIIQCRVEKARQLLLQNKMSIADIALACGFTHQSHLNRHFKRLTGVTPKSLKQDNGN